MIAWGLPSVRGDSGMGWVSDSRTYRWCGGLHREAQILQFQTDSEKDVQGPAPAALGLRPRSFLLLLKAAADVA